jgi:hypothetical protein
MYQQTRWCISEQLFETFILEHKHQFEICKHENSITLIFTVKLGSQFLELIFCNETFVCLQETILQFQQCSIENITSLYLNLLIKLIAVPIFYSEI